MTAKTGLRNPYIAGRALGQDRGFFGREDILRLVETMLQKPDQNALVLFGQRRIGKTSILLQLQRRLPSPPFLPVYFDLMDRARRPLGQVLFELASTIAAEAGMAPVEREQFDDQGLHFRQTFLPMLYQTLGTESSPVLLLDEFDVFDVAAGEHLPVTAAAQAFFPYLRELLEGEPRLKFVFVVGRRAEDLSINVKATFKASLYQRVSVLDEPTARELITTAERQGSLTFAPAAIERILALTASHPYFVQLLCQILWDNAYAGSPTDVPLIDLAMVEATAPKVLESGQNIFEWIWDGLPPAERVIFAAIAEATDEQSVVTEERLTRLLQSYGVRILTRELELAPRTLVEWEMLREVDGGYRFFIELMRRWVVLRKPLPRVKEELDRIVPQADLLYRSGDGFYRQGELGSAEGQLRQVLRLNPNHLKARLLLGQILFEQNRLGLSVKELEEVYRYDEDAARYSLIRILFAHGEELERSRYDNDALGVYRRILELSPNEKLARERQVAISTRRGNEALKLNNLEVALAAYQEADAQDKIAEVKDKIAEVKALKQKKERLPILYAAGTAAFERGNLSDAILMLSEAIYIQPDYSNTIDVLARAIHKQKKLRRSKINKYLPKTTSSTIIVFILSIFMPSIYILILMSISDEIWHNLSPYAILPLLLILIVSAINLFFIAARGIGYMLTTFPRHFVNTTIKRVDFSNRLNILGLEYLAKGENNRAISEFNIAIDLHYSAEKNTHRGMAYYVKGNYDLAIADFERAISLDPQYAKAYYYRGKAYQAKGDHPHMIIDFKHFLTLSDDAQLCQEVMELLETQKQNTGEGSE